MSFKEMTFDAVPENAEAVIGFIEEELEAQGCGFAELMAINVAVDEIFSNIAHYAYGGKIGTASVSVETDGDPLTARVTFTDEGIPFDPLSVPEPDPDLPPDEREIGGMGIQIVRKSMDSAEYVYREGKNIFSFTKRI